MSPTRAFIHISRPDYMLVGGLFAVAYGAIVCREWSVLTTHFDIVIAGSLMGIISHLLGSKINCLMDTELDAQNAHKGYLAQSVKALGARAVWVIFSVESLLALGLAALVGYLVDKPWLVLIWVAGWVLAVGYSVEPVRLKRRMFLNPLCLFTIIYLLPISFGYLAVNDAAHAMTLILAAGLGLQLFGLLLANEVEDIPEDRGQGVFTPCVQFGIRPIMRLAIALFAMGTVVVAIPFAAEFGRLGGLSIIFAAIYLSGIAFIVRDQMAVFVLAKGEQIGVMPEPNFFAPVRRMAARSKWHFVLLGLLSGVGAVIILA